MSAAQLLRDQSLPLRIEGTERLLPGPTKFVAAFGIDLRTLRDLRVYARGGDLESFPPALAALLRALHRNGCVSGAEAVALLFHGRPLGDGEALYFALVDLPPEPRVMAFVDRRRDRRPAGVPRAAAEARAGRARDRAPVIRSSSGRG